MCFAALGRRAQGRRDAGVHIRVKLPVHEGLLKLVPFIGAALLGFGDLARAGHFLFRGEFLQIARLDEIAHAVLLGLLSIFMRFMPAFETRRSDIGQLDATRCDCIGQPQYRSGTHCLPRRPASESCLSCLERFGSFTLSRGVSSKGTTLSKCDMQFRRAAFLSSDRMMCQGAWDVSVASSISSRAFV